MNIHEYQAKSILEQYGVPVPEGIVAVTSEEAVDAARQIQKITGTQTWAVKAQIHAGGRGKGGGVKIAGTIEEVRAFAEEILGLQGVD
jgi:succinyl-CoA synthetase beta subunit